jgi:uncharacterized membrane protein YhaH (DUF805 family)
MNAESLTGLAPTTTLFSAKLISAKEEHMENLDWGWYLFGFEGRINRGKFWLGWAVIWVFLFVTYGIALATESGFLIGLVGLLNLLAIWPALAIQIKRWHDRDKSGWWVLIGLIPLIGPIWVLVECGFLPGTVGPNQYGPDPLGPIGESAY